MTERRAEPEEPLLTNMPAPKRSGPQSAERRSFPRVDFNCPVRWSTAGADRFGTARDASENGAGFTVRALSSPKVGDKITLVFELDPNHEWVADTEARVARCDPIGDGLRDVGVQFSQLEIL